MASDALQERTTYPEPARARSENHAGRAVPDVYIFGAITAFVIATHITLLRLPYFWDEAGYYIPAARDLLAGSLIPHSTPSNAHPPLIMGWLALNWKIFGQSALITRIAMLLLAAFSLTGFYRLARAVSNSTVAAWSTFLTAIYPVFFAQSSLAQVDLPAAGLIFWALDAYFRKRKVATIICFSLAVLAKETAVLVPLALAAWEVILIFAARELSSFMQTVVLHGLETQERRGTQRYTKGIHIIALLLPVVPLAVWYGYHYARTGFVFGNPEFLRYNLQENFHPLRIVLALLLRLWQTFGYLNLYLLTIACVLAMKYLALPLGANRHSRTDEEAGYRARIALPVQFAFLAIATVYLLAMSILGGAVLARYMLPIVPLFILVAVSTIWRRLRAWKAVLGLIAAAFVLALFINPPYGFSPEDNLAYRDYIHLHQSAEAFIEARYSHAHVLTAWPASDELSRPNLGYVALPLQVLRIEDFTAENLMAAADERSRFDVALVFSTKVQPTLPIFDRWRTWQEWKTRYFGYHVDLNPAEAASVLRGRLVYVKQNRGQWVGVIETGRVEEATLITLTGNANDCRNKTRD